MTRTPRPPGRRRPIRQSRTAARGAAGALVAVLALLDLPAGATAMRPTGASSAASSSVGLAPAALPTAPGPTPAAVGALVAGWQWPLQPTPRVLARFGDPAGPYAAGKRGVDLAASVGQRVSAAGAGVVAFAGLVAGAPTVTIDHGSLTTTYQPVDAMVGVGVAVPAGGLRGTLSALPQLCAPLTCLHWGAYVDGSSPRRYLDPLGLLGAGPVRLLAPGAPAGAPPVAAALLAHAPGTAAGAAAAGNSGLGATPGSGAAEPVTHGSTDLVPGTPLSGTANSDNSGTAVSKPADSGIARSGTALSGAALSGAAPASARTPGVRLPVSARPTPPTRSAAPARAAGRADGRLLGRVGAAGALATAVGGGGLLLPALATIVGRARRRRPPPIAPSGQRP